MAKKKRKKSVGRSPANEQSKQSKQSKGGQERAKKLTPKERSESARKAAEARWRKEGDKGLPVATHGSADHPLRLGDVEIPCYVLDDNRRVLAQRGMISSMGMSSGAERLVSFVEGGRLKPFVSNDLLAAISNPIRFSPPHGGPSAFGYEATILADLCETVLEARDAGVLSKQQLHIAKQCEVLVRGFARVGIVALVDEATGYQYDRARSALEELLREFMSEELRAWVKTFPDSYFKQLCRLKNVPFRPDMRFPRYFGRMTVNIVYKRLVPGVLKELESRNPADDKGNRKVKHFQWLSEHVGQSRLLQHLGAVVGLMKISPDYETFKQHLDLVAPVVEDHDPSQILLPFSDED